MGSITPQQNVIGTLIVDLFDANKANSPAFRRIFQGVVDENGEQTWEQLVVAKNDRVRRDMHFYLLRTIRPKASRRCPLEVVLVLFPPVKSTLLARMC